MNTVSSNKNTDVQRNKIILNWIMKRDLKFCTLCNVEARLKIEWVFRENRRVKKSYLARRACTEAGQ